VDGRPLPVPTGIPTSPNLHEVVQAVIPEAVEATPQAAGGDLEPAADLAWLIGESLEDAQGAVTVRIAALEFDAAADTIEFAVAMDTHSVDLGMDLPLATTVRRYWEAAMDRLGGEADFSRIYQFVQGKRELKTLATRLGKSRHSASP